MTRQRDDEMTGAAANPRQVSAAEWVASGVGALLVLATVAFLAWEAVAGGTRPAEVTVRVDTVFAVPGGHLAKFSAHNRGDATAANVHLRGVLALPDGREEAREITLDYVPAHSTRRGGLYFSADPALGRLAIGPVGFTEP